MNDDKIEKGNYSFWVDNSAAMVDFLAADALWSKAWRIHRMAAMPSNNYRKIVPATIPTTQNLYIWY